MDGARAACEASLERLGLDYIDLLLVHWPNPDQGRYVEAFQGLVRLLEAGLVKSIGTSNFKPAHLQKLFDLGLVPHLNQIQLDPYHLRDDLVAIHREKGIVTGACTLSANGRKACCPCKAWAKPRWSNTAAFRRPWPQPAAPPASPCRSLPLWMQKPAWRPPIKRWML